MQKLMVSKQIMNRHDEMDKGVVPKSNRSNMTESRSYDEYDEKPIPATYNIPQEFLQQAQSTPPKQMVVTEDRIKNSKLPE